MHILLTGAAGFVGKQLLSALIKQKTFVRAVSDIEQPALAIADEVVIERLNPDSDFSALLDGIDMVIHLADGFNAYEHLPDTDINAEAAQKLRTTSALADAAAQKGVNFIYLSTIKTMCGAYADEILTETSPTKPQSLYGSLKLQAENAIKTATQKHGTRYVILRFPIVFGPGVGGNMEKLRGLLDSPFPVPLQGLNNRRSLISSASLIDAVMTIIAQKCTPKGVYLVQEGVITTSQLTKVIRQGLSRPDRQFKIPKRLWSIVLKLPVVGNMALRFIRPLELDDRHFRTTFQWQPPKPFEENLRQWSKEQSR